MDVRRLSLFLSPLFALAVALSMPETYLDVTGSTQSLSFSAHFVAGLVVWMALWWMFEPIAIYATALLPLVVLPISGVSSLSTVLSHYTSSLLVLFLGGFIIALALQRWGLHQRIAIATLSHIGGSPRLILGSIMIISAFFQFVDVKHFHYVDDGANCRKYCQSLPKLFLSSVATFHCVLVGCGVCSLNWRYWNDCWITA